MTWLLLALAFGGVVLVAVVQDMVKTEATTRFERLPRAVLRLARRRLPKTLRQGCHDEEWLPELLHIAQETEGLPITRMVRAIRYALGLLFAARSISAALDAANAAEAAEDDRTERRTQSGLVSSTFDASEMPVIDLVQHRAGPGQQLGRPLTARQHAALLTLMAIGKTGVSNRELRDRFGAEIVGPDRMLLNELGLVHTRRQGPQLVHELTDRGWMWCTQQLGAQCGPRVRGANAALSAVTAGLNRYMQRNGLTLVDIFGQEDGVRDIVTTAASG
ncbi:MAG TPA: hypothetical protein VEO01_14315 [Pseudonocardiaceae bacterium]|nr:hypothetical protein [Pseudonocardiaceae bacterium]